VALEVVPSLQFVGAPAALAAGAAGAADAGGAALPVVDGVAAF
jgi:hypothetical protein